MEEIVSRQEGKGKKEERKREKSKKGGHHDRQKRKKNAGQRKSDVRKVGDQKGKKFQLKKKKK